MKYLIRLVAIVTLILGSFSCDEITDSLNITFHNVTIEETINFSVPDSTITNGQIYTFNFNEGSTFSLDNASNGSNLDETLHDYLGSLSLVEVQSISFLIVDNIPDGESLIINNLIISIMQGSDELYSESFSDILPADTVVTTGLDSPIYDSISAALASSEDLTFVASGEATGNVTVFEIKETIILNIEANALETVKSLI